MALRDQNVCSHPREPKTHTGTHMFYIIKEVLSKKYNYIFMINICIIYTVLKIKEFKYNLTPSNEKNRSEKPFFNILNYFHLLVFNWIIFDHFLFKSVLNLNYRSVLTKATESSLISKRV